MMNKLALILIKIYQSFISPLLGPHCRYVPTCSEYAREALERYGFVKGSYLAARRVLRCTPLIKGGYAPVP